MLRDFPRGFEAWRPLSIAQARNLIQVLLGGGDPDSLPDIAVTAWKNVARPNLVDLSTLIKYTKDKSTFWVSTAINRDCGGQSGGAPIHHIRANLSHFSLGGSSLTALPLGRTGALKPTIMMDSDSLDTATLIALNHGPLDDAEVSFLTSIPLDVIVTPRVVSTSDTSSPSSTSVPAADASTSVSTPATNPASIIPSATPGSTIVFSSPPSRFEKAPMLAPKTSAAPALKLKKELTVAPSQDTPSSNWSWTCPTCLGTFDKPFKKTRHGFECPGAK